jgi:drug/metabolite transporter (DMT)-like permease
LVGLAALAVSFFAFLSLLSISNLSFSVPATAISYVLGTTLAKYVLKEAVTWRRWAAASLVSCGVVLLSR